MKDEDSFISRLFHLYKLHGSLNWEDNDGRIQINDTPAKPLMIFPRESKYENSYDQPFFEMMARFQQSIRPDSTVLVCIGYSFNDKHVNVAINEALDQNPGFQLIIVNLNINPENTLLFALHRTSKVFRKSDDY
ncbi:MAG: SIR2 family protein [Acidobacteria bacterium]|nr:SIR2 family protein [Acidobacteriota bacterium]